MMTKYPALSNHRIPSDVRSPEAFTEKLRKFKEINQTLKTIPMSARPDLVKNLRKKWIKGHEDVEVLREKKLVETYQLLEGTADLSTLDIRILNSLFTGKDSLSNYRSCPLYIRNARGEIEREFPPHEKIPELVKEVLTWQRENKDFISAFVLHFLILSIHPFEDGNGRVARACEWIALRKLGIQFRYDWNPEVIMHWQAARYNQILESCRHKNSVDEFVSFMLDGYLETGHALIS